MKCLIHQLRDLVKVWTEEERCGGRKCADYFTQWSASLH